MMNLLLSHALEDVCASLSIDPEHTVNIGKSSVSTNSLKRFYIYRHGSLRFLKRGKDFFDVEDHMKRNFLASWDISAMDLEFWWNRIEIENKRLLRFDEINEAILAASMCVGEVYRKLCSQSKEVNWVIGVNMQNHIGDYDTGLDDLKNITLSEVIFRKKAWWYFFDISFAVCRGMAIDYFKKIRLEGNWGKTLSPFQMLYVPADHMLS